MGGRPLSRPRLLDLFCGAGGASVGYQRAGFDVVGVDVVAQPRYPFELLQTDALDLLTDVRGIRAEFDVVHASPPCQGFTRARSIRGRGYVDLLTPTRQLLERLGLPWVVENVEGAPMRADALLCGSMFGLELQRHRLFESSEPLDVPPPCHHEWPRGRPVGVYGHTGGKATGVVSGNHGWSKTDWESAMGITWMRRDDLAQAVPPAYTEWVGSVILGGLRVRADVG